MNQNVKSFEEFKKIYTKQEFQDKLKELYKLKQRYKKFVIYMLISVIVIYASLIASVVGIILALTVIVTVGVICFGKKRVREYPIRYKLEIPHLIAKTSGIQLITKEIDSEEFFEGLDQQKGKSKRIAYTLKATREYEKAKDKRIRQMNEVNCRQFMESGIVKADEYYTNNIARFIHNDTDATIDLYQAEAYVIREKIYKDENGKEKTEKVKNLENKGLVLSIENLTNIKLKDISILIKNNDTLLSHLTESTIDNFKSMRNEIKFNRIDLNKSFDCYIYGNKNDNENSKLEAMKIITPTVEDLLAYIRKKYGRYNLAVNNNKIDIELLDIDRIGIIKGKYKNVIITPKTFSNKDLKISYLYRFYELIEIQKLILKYLNCFPEKYLITEEDVNGLKEAIESNKLTDYEMDKSVEKSFKKIMGRN